ncbi:MAG: N-acetylmuramoyl-L-alanine amidase [Bacteroidales bacterium]|nr:N-acetylmuramoyl-L-alanine amidase [Bacteroidales bacterium]
MKKLLITMSAVFIATATALAGGNLTKTQARIYINPGHGSWGPNDRNMATINHATGDTCGFYESNTNLWKGLKMGATLEKWGVPKANIMYSRVKNGPYPYVKGAADEELYNRNLTEIAEECNAFNTDYFLSIHSDAGTEGGSTNLSLLIYNGYSVPAADDENMWEGERSLEYQKTSRAMAETLWPILDSNGIDVYSSTAVRIVGDLTFYYKYNTPADNVKKAAGYLGVLRRNTSNGFLSEGYCHTYQPARHRALNRDYCGQEGVRLARGVAAWFGWETENTGYIMGSVKDLHETFVSMYYHGNPTSKDIFKPINGAVVTLYKGGVELKKYTTDNEYNGVFVFEGLEPGDDYTINVEAEGYKSAFALNDEYGRENPTYSVTSCETTYPIIQLEAEGYVENPTYNYPDPIQDEWLTVSSKYDMRKDFVSKKIDVLADKTIRREVAKGDSVYVLALDAQKKPYIYCFDAKTQTKLFDISTEGVGMPNDGNELLALSDIAMTSDSILVACNQVAATFTPSTVLRMYRWDRDEKTRAPKGNPQIWFTSSDNYTSGNFFNSITGSTMAVNGRSDDCTVITTAQNSGSSDEIRFPMFSITRKGLIGTIRNQDKTRFKVSLLGADYQLSTSPFADKAFIIDGSKVTPFEFSISGDATAPVYGSKLSEDVVSAAAGNTSFFKYAKHVLAVVPKTDGKGANVGVALYDVTGGLDKAQLIETTGTDMAAAQPTFVNVYSGVNGTDMSLYLNADGAMSRFTTEGVDQEQFKGVYAYGLKVTEADDNFTFAFNATDDCTRGGKLIFYDAASGAKVGETAIDEVKEGNNEVVVAATELPGEGAQQLKWAVEVASDNVAGIRNLLTKDGDYALNRAYAVVDASPASPNMGKIYVSDFVGKNNAKNGVYVYNQSYARENAAPYTGAYYTNASMALDANGNAYLMETAGNTPGVLRAGADAVNGAFSAFFTGGADVAGVANSVAFRGEGADTKMYAFMKNSAGKNVINVYNVGNANGVVAATWGLAPNKVIEMPSKINDDATIVPVEQGIWVCASEVVQTTSVNSPALLFVDYEGNITFNQGRDENAYLLAGAAGSGIAVSADGATLCVNDEGGLLQFFDVTWKENTPTITPRYSFNHEIGVASRRNTNGKCIEQMAFDYAGNLVAAGHYLGVFTIPTTDNRKETPAMQTVTRKVSGISDITIDDDNTPVEYFNLQGVKVNNPENGVFIKRQGKKVEKVILR